MVIKTQEDIFGDVMPNVYIAKVSLESLGDLGAVSSTVKLVIKEKFGSDLLGNWFANQDLSKYLKVKVIQSIDEKATAILSAGSDFVELIEPTESISEKDPRVRLAMSVFKVNSLFELNEKFREYVSTHTIAIDKQGTDEGNPTRDFQKSTDIDGSVVYDIPYSNRFEILTAPKHLSYFALSSIDVLELAKDYELELESTKLKKINGKIMSEVIIDDLEVKSSKTQDFRRTNEIDKLTIDFSDVHNFTPDFDKLRRVGPKKEPVSFSELLLSTNKDGDNKFFFSIDFDKMISENSAFGNFFKQANKRTKATILAESSINSMRVLRRRIKRSTNNNRMGISESIKPFEDEITADELVAVSGEKEWKNFTSSRLSTGVLKEVNIVSEDTNSVRHFTGIDLSMSELTDGIYQYIVELDVVDVSALFLEKKIQILRNIESILGYYLNDGNSRNHYDLNSDRFTQDFIDQQRRKYQRNPEQAPWVSAISQYVDVLTILSAMMESTRTNNKLIKSLYSYVAPETSNPHSISIVISLIDNTIASIEKIIGHKSDDSHLLDNSTYKSRVSQKNERNKSFKVVKEFKEVVDSNIVKIHGADYLSRGVDETENNDGIRSISNEVYADRVAEETLKYFKTREPNIDMSFGSSKFTENDSIRNTNFSFLSPSRIDLPKTSFILSNSSVGNIKQNDSKKNRFVKVIGDSDLKSEEQAMNLYSSMLSFNTTKVMPILHSEKDDKRGDRKENVKTNETEIKNSFANTLSLQASFTSLNLKVKVLKDINDDLVSIEPVREATPTTSFNCVIPEESVEVESRERTSEATDDSALNLFYFSILKPTSKATVNFMPTINHDNLNLKATPTSTKATPFKSFNLQTLNVVSVPSFVPLQTQNITIQQERQNTEETFTPLNTNMMVIQGLNKNVSQDQMKQLPNQIKAIFLQTSSQNVVNPEKMRGVLSQDFEESSRHIATRTFDYEMLMKVEYFSGFAKSENGEISIKEPIWKLLTDEKNNEFVGENILCRLIPYENVDFGIHVNENVKANVYDKYFILKPKKKRIVGEVREPPERKILEIDKSFSINNIFDTNNVVAQTSFNDFVQQTNMKNKGDSYVSLLENKVGSMVANSLNPTEEQAKIIYSAISPSAKTEEESFKSVENIVQNMFFSSDASSVPNKNTIVDLIKKSKN